MTKLHFEVPSRWFQGRPTYKCNDLAVDRDNMTKNTGEVTCKTCLYLMKRDGELPEVRTDDLFDDRTGG